MDTFRLLTPPNPPVAPELIGAGLPLIGLVRGVLFSVDPAPAADTGPVTTPGATPVLPPKLLPFPAPATLPLPLRTSLVARAATVGAVLVSGTSFSEEGGDRTGVRA